MPNVQVTYEKDPIMFTNIVQNHTKVNDSFFENNETTNNQDYVSDDILSKKRI